MVAEKQRACAADLAEAEVVLSAAREALDTLNKVGDLSVGSRCQLVLAALGWGDAQ